MAAAVVISMLGHEARAMLSRLAWVKPFALHMPMVAAAGSLNAQRVIEPYLMNGRDQLRDMVTEYLRWLTGPKGRAAPDSEAQRRFTVLRLRFNVALTQFDLFSDVLTQRSEHGFGVWLAGLDVVAADALALPGRYFEAPPVICYLERGLGAAIRRARTRLPGGGANPVAIIRVPRERMVGTGIASSLVHEVGHQGSVLLGLIDSLRPELQDMQSGRGVERSAWEFWERWISEILADFWSVAKVGVASTLGLMGVVSLPRAFVFRVNVDDPHPIPWIRVKLSAAIGAALYPHPQWRRLGRVWEAYYPKTGLDPDRERILSDLEATLPRFVALLVNHRPRSLRGKSLMEAFAVHERQPARLSALYRTWRHRPGTMRAASPTLAFAVLGQARADGVLPPGAESRIIDGLLRHWALSRALYPAPTGGRTTRRLQARSSALQIEAAFTA